MFYNNFTAIYDQLLEEKKFRSLTSNEVRINYLLAKIKSKEEFRDEIFNKANDYCVDHYKSLQRSQSFRAEGHDYYEKKDYGHAIHLFTQAILNAPFPTESDECHELSLSYQSRSIVYFQMGNYENALFDANQSLKLKSKVDMLLHKVYCLKFFKRFKEAKQLVDQVLDNKDMHDFEGKTQVFDQMIQFKRIVDQELNENEEKVVGTEEPEYLSFNHNLWINRKCKFEKTPVKGRHLSATDFIPKNSALLIEKAQYFSLMRESSMSYCSNCLKSIGNKFWPCIHCNEVVFCDQKCADEAMARFHKYECGIIGILNQLNRACYQIFRIFTIIGCENAFEIHKTFNRNEFDIYDWIAKHKNQCNDEKPQSMPEMLDDFKGMQTLLDNNENYDIETNTTHMLFAIETAILLQYSNALECKDTKTFISFTAFIIIQMRKVLTNTFGSFEFNFKDCSKKLTRKHVANFICIIGSFVNHSCSPNAFWYTRDGKLRIKTTENINAGQEICISYGPNQNIPFKNRQHILRKNYHFYCDCSLCLKESKTIELQCLECDGSVIYRVSSLNESCLKCGKKYENIRRTLKKLQFFRLSFDRMVENIENGISRDQSLKKLEELFEVIKTLVYSKSDELLELNKRISKIFEKFGECGNAVECAEYSLPSITELESDIECNNFDELLFVTNAYYMLLKDEMDREEEKWNKCFDLFSELLQNYKSLKKNCKTLKIIDSESVELIIKTKKKEFKHLKKVYVKLFTE